MGALSSLNTITSTIIRLFVEAHAHTKAYALSLCEGVIKYVPNGLGQWSHFAYIMNIKRRNDICINVNL